MLELVHEGLLDKTVAAEKLGIFLEELEKSSKILIDWVQWLSRWFDEIAANTRDFSHELAAKNVCHLKNK